MSDELREWTAEDTKNIFKAFGWLGKTVVKTTVVTAVVVTTGTVGLSLLARIKNGDYPVE